jgi:hypothetical protein
MEFDAERMLLSERGDFLDAVPMTHHIATEQSTHLAFNPPHWPYSSAI